MSGPFTTNWISALCCPPPPMAAIGRTAVRSPADAYWAVSSFRTGVATGEHVPVALAERHAAARRSCATFAVRAESSATVTIVKATSG